MKFDIENFDVTQLPDAENEKFEFKSSLTEDSELKKKIACATSGFANSGGGFFVAGIDKYGNADGGISLKVGKKNRQDRRDWVDQIIHDVEPTPEYEIQLITDSLERGNITEGNAVLLIYIHSSNIAPHMAPDHCYYIRAGAHTVKASHFILEAIRAKRYFIKPQLQHLLRLHPDKPLIIQLGIISITGSAALNVQISIQPIPKYCKEDLFPIQIALIDRDHPCFLDLALYADISTVSDPNTSIKITYCDLAGNNYEYEATEIFKNSLPPMMLGKKNLEEIAKFLKSIDQKLESLKLIDKKLARFLPPNIQNF